MPGSLPFPEALMAAVYYGGQAVIEGVMMRGASRATTFVRDPGGALVARREDLPAVLYGGRVSRLPFVRGIVMLWEMLVLGTRMMLFSAGVQARRSPGEDVPRGVVAGVLLFSLAFVIALFFVVPLFVARLGGGWAHGSLAGNLVEGLVRLCFFLAYLGLLGRLERMRRVFQYHGAEHKTINAYEAGAALTPRSVQTFSTLHVRCGTAFLLWVLVLSIVVFALIGHPPILLGVLSRILLVPVIAACGYELLRLGARYYSVRPVRWLVQPGLWMQRLTTREPTDDQVEVAIAALKDVLTADGVLPMIAVEAEAVPS
jgi:uncharacterized protein YqhQ